MVKVNIPSISFRKKPKYKCKKFISRPSNSLVSSRRLKFFLLVFGHLCYCPKILLPHSSSSSLSSFCFKRELLKSQRGPIKMPSFSFVSGNGRKRLKVTKILKRSSSGSFFNYTTNNNTTL